MNNLLLIVFNTLYRTTRSFVIPMGVAEEHLSMLRSVSSVNSHSSLLSDENYDNLMACRALVARQGEFCSKEIPANWHMKFTQFEQYNSAFSAKISEVIFL